jgi:hypothetical protein
MRKAATWGCAVLVSTVAGAAFGWLDAEVLRRVHLDYVVDASHVITRALKAGVLLGTLFGAAAVISDRAPARLADLVRVGLAAALAAGAIVVLTALITYVAARLGWYQLPDDIARQVDHPNRMALCLGIQSGGIAGAVVAAIVLVRFTWRCRLRQ